MESLTVPLITATVFTAGGYAITRAGRHAEAIGDWLFTVFLLTTMGTAMAFAGQAIERHSPQTQGTREAMIRSQTVSSPSWQAWAQLGAP